MGGRGSKELGAATARGCLLKEFNYPTGTKYFKTINGIKMTIGPVEALEMYRAEKAKTARQEKKGLIHPTQTVQELVREKREAMGAEVAREEDRRFREERRVSREAARQRVLEEQRLKKATEATMIEVATKALHKDVAVKFVVSMKVTDHRMELGRPRCGVEITYTNGIVAFWYADGAERGVDTSSARANLARPSVFGCEYRIPKPYQILAHVWFDEDGALVRSTEPSDIPTFVTSVIWLWPRLDGPLSLFFYDGLRAFVDALPSVPANESGESGVKWWSRYVAVLLNGHGLRVTFKAYKNPTRRRIINLNSNPIEDAHCNVVSMERVDEEYPCASPRCRIIDGSCVNLYVFEYTGFSVERTVVNHETVIWNAPVEVTYANGDIIRSVFVDRSGGFVGRATLVRPDGSTLETFNGVPTGAAVVDAPEAPPAYSLGTQDATDDGVAADDVSSMTSSSSDVP